MVPFKRACRMLSESACAASAVARNFADHGPSSASQTGPDLEDLSWRARVEVVHSTWYAELELHVPSSSDRFLLAAESSRNIEWLAITGFGTVTRLIVGHEMSSTFSRTILRVRVFLRGLYGF